MPQHSLSSTSISSPPHHHLCAIANCHLTTTSAALDPAFIPVLSSCFPPIHGQDAFTSKSTIYLCRVHRAMLNQHRHHILQKHQQTHITWIDVDHLTQHQQQQGQRQGEARDGEGRGGETDQPYTPLLTSSPSSIHIQTINTYQS